jgi:phosphoglycerol transferase MdoB-like AlkP superfamily enzyme
MHRWNRFLAHFQNDFKLWLFCIFLLEAYRLFYIFSYRYKIVDHSDLSVFLSVFFYGLKYDAIVAGWFIIVPFVFSVLCGFLDIEQLADRVRQIMGYLFISSFMVLGTINFGYFKEYYEPIDTLIFQLFRDDITACFKTLWKDYNLLRYSLVFAAVTYAAVNGLRWFLAHKFLPESSFTRFFSHSWKKILAMCFITVFMAASLWGFAWYKPVGYQHINVTNDEFLNKNILNPYLLLHTAVIDYLCLTRLSIGLERYLPDRDIIRAAQVSFSTAERFENLDNYFQRTAEGTRITPPRHIFLIIGESYDAWPFMEKYQSLHVMDNLRYFAENGIYFEHFLPASINTMFSLGVIITGLPDSGKLINYNKSSHKPYPTSITESFKRLGYRTRFFYGGYNSWQKINDFCTAQGFEEVYTQRSSHLADNPWGIDDADLFRQVLDKVGDNQPSFNIIMMTNNHPPYRSLSFFRQKGFSMKKIPDDILPFCDITLDMRLIAAKWYTDNCIGEFVRSTEKSVNRPLFVITGDHYGRRFLNANPPLKERSDVPLDL